MVQTHFLRTVRIKCHAFQTQVFNQLKFKQQKNKTRTENRILSLGLLIIAKEHVNRYITTQTLILLFIQILKQKNRLSKTNKVYH